MGKNRPQEVLGQSENERLTSTACWIAAVRAHESGRRDGFFHDPWAELLASEEGQIWRERMTGGKEEHAVGLVIRTRFFDDCLLRVVGEHQIEPAVIMAAGMDTRAFRLPWSPHMRLFELDLPQLFAQKERLLATAGALPTCSGRLWALISAVSGTVLCSRLGLTRASPLFGSWKVFSLPTEVVTRLLKGMTRLSARGSWLGCACKNTAMGTSPFTRSWITALAAEGAPWISRRDDPEASLAEYGWDATVVQPGEDGAHFGRWPFQVISCPAAGLPRPFFVTAQRR